MEETKKWMEWYKERLDKRLEEHGFDIPIQDWALVSFEADLNIVGAQTTRREAV